MNIERRLQGLVNHSTMKTCILDDQITLYWSEMAVHEFQQATWRNSMYLWSGFRDNKSDER